MSIIGSRCPSLTDDTKVIVDRYRDLLSAYSKCMFSHCSYMTDEEITSLQSNIEAFMKLCCEHVVSRQLGHITPKLHLLESHIVSSIKRLRVGLGCLAEQGSESIHAKFNTLQRDYASMPNKLDRLKAVTMQHLVSTLPQREALHPAPKKRRATSQS
eukprot:scpid43743/ scgid35469/ 